MQCLLIPQLQCLQQEDELYGPIISSLQTNSSLHPAFTWKQNLLWYKGKLIVPDDNQLKQHLLQEYHATYIGGHADILRTYVRLAHQFFGLT